MSQAQAAVDKALEHIEKEHSEVNQTRLRLWYLYFRGQIPALNARLKSLMSTGQPISASAYEKLFETFVLKAHFTESLGLDEQTGTIIDRAEDLKGKIHDFVDQVQQHQVNLGDMRDSLSVAKTRESVEIILSQAVSELQSVESNSMDTTLWMQKNLEDLKSIQEEVVEIEQSLTRDFLTGLPDKDYFDKTLMQMIEASMSGLISQRYLIVFDIKELIHYNQAYSWLVGDSIIRLVVKMIQAQTPGDWEMMRYLDDALVVMPPVKTSAHQLPGYIETILTSIKQKKIKVKGEQKPIKDIVLNAVMLKVHVYDDITSVDKKIAEGLRKVSADTNTQMIEYDP